MADENYTKSNKGIYEILDCKIKEKGSVKPHPTDERLAILEGEFIHNVNTLWLGDQERHIPRWFRTSGGQQATTSWLYR